LIRGSVRSVSGETVEAILWIEQGIEVSGTRLNAWLAVFSGAKG
jgi:hypothetical protein